MLKNLDNVDELMAVSYLAGPFIVNLFKMLTIYKNMDRIKVLMRKLNDPLFQPNSKKQFEIAMKTKKFHRNFFYLCLYLGVQTYLCFMILPFLREKKTIPTQGWFPFEYDHSPNYEAVYLFQNCVVLWNDIICLNLDTFSSGLLMQISMQCDYLCNSLNNLSSYRAKDGILIIKEDAGFKMRMASSEFSQAMMENLIICIQHHKKIKR
ncbi:unnamed protein product [Psylliodes chrysocephalus]|uniref:Uncharacterized protein n=1 Tax=Psylliodes chrysocephalus TaxID=3402493 RepID=A0A9P0GH13_9CUCU|nr:unnamed protein product [Psylliodes chrysocephala]